MALPLNYFDVKNKAPQRYADFLLHWGTHFVKSASFGGKFTLLRQSEISIEETREGWSAKMQTSANSLFESRSSSAGAGVYWSAYGYCSNMTTFSSFFRSADDTETTEQPILIDHGFT